MSSLPLKRKEHKQNKRQEFIASTKKNQTSKYKRDVYIFFLSKISCFNFFLPSLDEKSTAITTALPNAAVNFPRCRFLPWCYCFFMLYSAELNGEKYSLFIVKIWSSLTVFTSLFSIKYAEGDNQAIRKNNKSERAEFY